VLVACFRGTRFLIPNVTFKPLSLLISKPVTLKEKELKETFLKQVQTSEQLIYKVCHFYANNEADKQDLYQEILIQLWKSYPKFKGESKFSTWLYQVAINTAIAGLRKKKNHVLPYDPDSLPAEISESNSFLQKEEMFAEMYAAIEKLNEIEKAIVLLFIDGKPYTEMEEILGIPDGTLRVKMNRIKEKLRQIIKTD
jgi:RNA polymerase sigma-70 factor, ECF subfamily